MHFHVSCNKFQIDRGQWDILRNMVFNLTDFHPYCYNCEHIYDPFISIWYWIFQNEISNMASCKIMYINYLHASVIEKYHQNACCVLTLRWRHNERDGDSNHQPHDCLLNRLFTRRSKKTSKLCVTGLCVGNSPGTGEFPTQMASNAEKVSIWWLHYEFSASEGVTHRKWPYNRVNTVVSNDMMLVSLYGKLTLESCGVQRAL